MQTPEEMLKRTYAAKPRKEPNPIEKAVKMPEQARARPDTTNRKLVMNPIKINGVYRQLMEKHDRMGTRHLG